MTHDEQIDALDALNKLCGIIARKQIVKDENFGLILDAKETICEAIKALKAERDELREALIAAEVCIPFEGKINAMARSKIEKTLKKGLDDESR